MLLFADDPNAATMTPAGSRPSPGAAPTKTDNAPQRPAITDTGRARTDMPHEAPRCGRRRSRRAAGGGGAGALETSPDRVTCTPLGAVSTATVKARRDAPAIAVRDRGPASFLPRSMRGDTKPA